MSGHVLIVDPQSTNRIVMRARLAAAYYDTVMAASGQEALEQLSQPGIALAVIAADLPDMKGVELCRQLRASHAPGQLPVVMLAPRLDPGFRLDALTAGADAVLDRPVNDALLLARVRSLLRDSDSLEELRLREGSNRALGMGMAEPAQAFHAQGRICVIGDDRARARNMARRLDARLPHAVTQADGPKVMAATALPDLAVVVLTGRPDDSALHMISNLRAQPGTRGMAIMALLPHDDDALLATALDCGASDAAALPLQDAELDLRLSRLVAAKQRADRQRDTVHDGLRAAVTDPLTGLYNRRYALPQLAHMAQAARERKTGLAVMIADLDHFKSVNDRFGHAAGDAALHQVAQRLRIALRPGDLLARIGGEEFLIAAQRPSCRAAKGLARSLCDAVSRAPLSLPGLATPVHQTISVGLAMSDPASIPRGAEALLAQADRALYSAKTEGRNKVTLAAQSAA